ncbi:GNAT family N-acetyltransferase [Clostridium sp.]|uniref:GNAT family N-acetyltransferase n=1 Tax=Clostridium sp. TaxID=1506 RepID=UPI002FC8B2DA
MKPENIIIRRFESSDSIEVCDIIKRNLIKVNSKDYPAHIINNMCDLYTSEHIIEIAKARDIYVAELNGKLIGTASLDKHIICAVYVNIDYHNRGIGRRLMCFIEEVAKHKSIKFLRLHASLTSLNFYYTLGYKYIEELNDPEAGKSTLVEKVLF